MEELKELLITNVPLFFKKLIELVRSKEIRVLRGILKQSHKSLPCFSNLKYIGFYNEFYDKDYQKTKIGVTFIFPDKCIITYWIEKKATHMISKTDFEFAREFNWIKCRKHHLRAFQNRYRSDVPKLVFL